MKIDLKVLAQKLDDILLYVEPSSNSLATYGHKLREFLILENCLNAIAANIILFCIRFSPYKLTGGHDNFANLINEHFEIKLNNPDFRSFYVPFMKNFSIGTGVCSGNYRVGFQNGWDWTVLPFSI